MLDFNNIKNPNLTDLKVIWETLKNETVYFLNENEHCEYLNNNNKPVTLKGYFEILKIPINFELNYEILEENKKLNEENKQLKKRIKELTNLEKYKKFDSLEPKKKIKVTTEELKEIKKLKKEKIPVRVIAEIYGITKQTVYNYLKKDN